MDDYSYLGVGRTYLRERGVPGALTEIGNASVLTFGVSEDEKKLKDYTQPGGGTRNAVRRVDAVTANITFHDLNAGNLARFLLGTKSSVAAGAVAAEAAVAYRDGYVSLAKMPAATPAPTVVGGGAAAARANTTAYTVGTLLIPAVANGYVYKVTTAGTSAAAPPTFGIVVGGTTVDGTATLTNVGKTALVENTDFEVRSGGIYFLPTAGVGDGLPVAISYTAVASEAVDALTTSGKEYELVFDGLNEARSGKRTKITAFRVKPGALQELALIGEDYAAPSVTIELLQDPTRVGVGVSKYFRAEIEL